MDKWVRLVSMTVLMLMIGSWSVSHAQNLSQDRTAMSWADQQRMLSQRMAKNWVLLAHEAMRMEQRQQLTNSIVQFEQNLAQLSMYAQTNSGAWQGDLATLKGQWLVYREVLTKTPQRPLIPQLLAAADYTLKLSEQLVTSLKSAQNLGMTGVLLDVAGQQSMLSQRIVLLYATQTQFGQAGDIGVQYQQAIQSFVRGMKRLESFQGHSPRIKQTIAAVQTRWRFTEYVFQQPCSLARVVDVNCEQLLNDLNAITSAYVVMDVR